MKRVAPALALFALVGVASATEYRVVILGQHLPFGLVAQSVDWPYVATQMYYDWNRNQQVAALVWDMGTKRAVDFRPRGFHSAGVNAMAHGVQAGYVRPANGARGYAALWRGTPESFVFLHPFPTAGGFDSRVNDTDGTYQVGNASDGDRNLALVWKGTRESVQVYNPPGCRVAVAWGIDWPYVCGSAVGYGAILWNGGPDKFVSLHPFPYESSGIYATRAGVQVGTVFGGVLRLEGAAMWTGTASSFRLLHRFAWLQSHMLDTNGRTHVGWAQRYSDYRRIAIAFEGVDSPSYVDLHAMLPPGYTSSSALDIDKEGVIVGNAFIGDTPSVALWIPER